MSSALEPAVLVRMCHPLTTPRRLSLPAVWLLLALTGLIALPGCSGCQSTGPTAAAKKKKDDKKAAVDEAEELIKKRTAKKEKPKDDFEPLAVRLLPSNDPAPSIRQQQLHIKPGHWMAISETAKTNNFDFAGELSVFCEQNATNLPLVVEDTTSRLSSWCPAMLPKGQTKRIEALFYIPRREKDLSVYSIRSELRSLRAGRTEMFGAAVSPSLRPYEHLIVVLAGGDSSPASYTHFDRLLSVRLRDIEASNQQALRYYYVLRPTVDRTVPLPSHALAWTTIAFLFWDDLDPALLTNFQQEALLDWLHWGGQLVISGPNSLDKLKGSFLAPYLPGESTEAAKLDQAAFDELNERYSLERNPALVAKLPEPPKGEQLRRITINPKQPVVGVELRLNSAAQPIDGTGGLVVERRIGGGRVVVTRFPLSDIRIRNWKNFDNFFNAVLLRRPGRVFKEHELALDFHWNDPHLELMIEDGRLGSTLRYFTRDIGWARDLARAGDENNRGPREPQRINPPRPAPRATVGAGSRFSPYDFDDGPKIRPDTSRINPDTDDWHFAGYGATWPENRYFGPGKEMEPLSVASWTDDAAASSAARAILTEAAGIEIPSADFVIKVLAVYLLVLVPINWLVFWLLGKVEWAWIAAPIIALVGAGAVIRLAQLDIGFARSRTEVAVLELQAGYERAHLTRYTALYTSLSSSYALQFDDPTAIAAPFPAGQQDESILSITNFTDVLFRRDKGASLAGVQVSSNSTGMVHSEQMLALGASPKTVESLRLVGDGASGYSISNTTDLVIRDIGVFRRAEPASGVSPTSSSRIEVAYVPKLDAASSAVLRFETLQAVPGSPSAWEPVPGTKESFERVDGRRETVVEQQDRERRYKAPAVWLDAWNKVPIFALPGSAAEKQNLLGNEARIRLTRLARLAADQLRLLPGDVRLIGWTDQSLPGLRIRPEAPQNRTYTLVLAHLARGQLPPPKPDANVAEDYINPTLLDAETDPQGGTP